MDKMGTPLNLDYHRSLKPQARKWDFLTENIISKNKKIKILDVGCGNGSILLQLKKLGFSHLYGVDYEPLMFEKTVTNQSDLKITQGEAQNLIAYKKGFFDLVLSCHVLEHLANPEKAVSEAARVLKKDGYFIVAVPNGYHLNDLLIRLIQRIGYGSCDHLQKFSQKKIIKLIEKQGFKLIKLQVNKGSLELLKDVRIRRGSFFFRKILYPAVKFFYWKEISFEMMFKKSPRVGQKI